MSALTTSPGFPPDPSALAPVVLEAVRVDDLGTLNALLDPWELPPEQAATIRGGDGTNDVNGAWEQGRRRVLDALRLGNVLGTTALMLAAELGQRDSLDRLVRFDPSLALMVVHGKTALMRAIEEEQDDCFERLLPVSHVRAQGDGGDNALTLAVRYRRVAMVSRLLEADGGEAQAFDGQDPAVSPRPPSLQTARTTAGRTALMEAVAAGDDEVFRQVLVASDEAVRAMQDLQDYTALMLAAEQDQMGAVNALIEPGTAWLCNQDQQTAFDLIAFEVDVHTDNDRRVEMMDRLAALAPNDPKVLCVVEDHGVQHFPRWQAERIRLDQAGLREAMGTIPGAHRAERRPRSRL